jgi:uncharacterized membrane-anchored protein
MSIKNISIIAFIVLAVVQLAVPASMIWHREGVLANGKTYKFLCRPIDPNDPFRGKYVTLRFEAERVEPEDYEILSRGDAAYGILAEDENGYAYIKNILKEIPQSDEDYIPITIRSGWSGKSIRVRLPFDRYYMNEVKAPEAERIYFEELRDRDSEVVALVNVGSGTAVLKAVLVDGVALEDLLD